MYTERPSTISGAVVWRSTSDGSVSAILPDGCMDVIWIDGRLVVAGPDPVSRHHLASVGSVAVGLRFAPGQAPAVLSLPASELLGRTVGLDQSSSFGRPDRARLADVIDAAGDPGEALESAFVDHARRAHDPVREAVVAGLRSGRTVGAVADQVGLSARQLQRRSIEWFGYGPKHLSTILRLQRALAWSATGLGTAAVAVSAGYADQSHLGRDARRLTGSSFGSLVGR